MDIRTLLNQIASAEVQLNTTATLIAEADLPDIAADQKR
jgi:hypothetical protein